MDEITSKDELKQKLKEMGIDCNSVNDYCKANYYPHRPKLYMNVLEQTEEESIKLLELNPYNIRFVRKPTLQMCYYAFIEKNYSIIYFNEEILPYFEEHFYELLQKDKSIFSRMNYQTENICIYAINKDANNIKYVKNKTEKVLLALDEKLKEPKKQHKSMYTEDIYKDFRKYMKKNNDYLYIDLYIDYYSTRDKLNNMPVDMLLHIIKANPVFSQYIDYEKREIIDLVFIKNCKVYKYIYSSNYVIIITVEIKNNKIILRPKPIKVDRFKNIEFDLTKIPYLPEDIRKHILKQFDFIKNIDCLSKDDCVNLINYDPNNFLLIDNHSDELYIYLINNCKNSGHLIYIIKDYVKELSVTMLFELIKKGVYLDKHSFKKLSLKNQISSLAYNGRHIKFMDNPTSKMAEVAFKTYAKAIKYIKNPTEQMYFTALRSGACHIKNIEKPTNEMCLFAIKENPIDIKYIKNPTKEMCLTAFEVCISSTTNYGVRLNKQYILKQFDFIKNTDCLSKDDCVKLIDHNPITFLLMDNHSDELYLYLIDNCKNKSHVGYVIENYVKEPSEIVLFEAIKKCVIFDKHLFRSAISNIEIIKKFDKEMFLLALEADPSCLIYKNEFKEQMQLNTLEPSKCHITDTKKPTEEMYLRSLKSGLTHIKDIKNPTEEMCLIAIEKNPLNIAHIRKPTYKTCVVALKSFDKDINCTTNFIDEGYLDNIIEINDKLDFSILREIYNLARNKNNACFYKDINTLIYNIKLAFINKLTNYRFKYNDWYLISVCKHFFKKANIETLIFKDKNFDYEKTLQLFKKHTFLIPLLGARPEKFYIDILGVYPEAIRHIKNPTNEMVLNILRCRPYLIEFIKNPTYEMISEVSTYYRYKTIEKIPEKILYNDMYHIFTGGVSQVEKFNFSLFEYLN